MRRLLLGIFVAISVGITAYLGAATYLAPAAPHAVLSTTSCQGTLVGAGAPLVGGFGQSGICTFQSPGSLTLRLSWAGLGSAPMQGKAWLHLEGSENTWLEAPDGWTLHPPSGELDVTLEPDSPGTWGYALGGGGP